ncbi:sterol desaturase [Podospora aff. communis PSN243]|uniref:Sterol desaturase n=1 Tax=Podospora aff. communis PSN243 TaxID=3040156 RepID=A0AAV9GIL6_9PEZI|nr:sterol desaturase [Podospora aff. communis PSN243]
MDLLMSVPIASYFFSTSLTSWSTSLNLLFFYMTWTTLILSHSPLKIELFGTLGLRIVFWLIPSLFFLLIDTLLPSLAESIKYNGASALPPRDGRSLARLIGLALFNLTLETVLEGLLSLGAALYLKAPIFRAATTFPLPWQMAKHVALLFAARELLTYFIHRYILHAQYPSRTTRCIAAQHARCAHHRRAAPFSLLLMADHPIPFLLHRFVPIYLPALLLQRSLHMLTFFLFFGLCTVEETLTMSGYTIVPGIIMGGITRRNSLHYSRPTGNFGCWGVLDWMHGTSLGGDVMQDVKDEAEKHHLKEKGEKAADDAGNMIQEGIEGLRRSRRNKGRKSMANGSE